MKVVRDDERRRLERALRDTVETLAIGESAEQ